MNKLRTLASIGRITVSCPDCLFPELCMWTGVSARDLELLDQMPHPYARRRIKQGALVYRAGDAFNNIYAIRTGFFENCIDLKDGRSQVVGFRMPGDILGMEGIGAGSYTSTAVALEDSEVCAFPMSRVEKLSRDIQNLAHRLHQVMSREIVRDQQVMLLLGSQTAQVRLAAFLVDISHRLAARGHEAAKFDLPMSRERISSYLGLTIETISRMFSRLQAEQLIEVKHRHIRILDPAGLARML